MATMFPNVDSSSVNDLNAATRKRAQGLMSGQGIPSAEQMFQGQKPMIEHKSSMGARSDAASLAQRGLSRSGFQGGAINQAYANQAGQLGQARLRDEQQSDAMRNEAYNQGLNMMGGAADREQALKLLEYQKRQADVNQLEQRRNAHAGLFGPAAPIYSGLGAIGQALFGVSPETYGPWSG